MTGDQFVWLILAAIAFAGLVTCAIEFWVHSGRVYDQAIQQAEYERRDS